MNFLQRNSYKLADYLYKYREFSCITRIQLNFYIIMRKSAENEIERKYKIVCMYVVANLVTG